MFVNKKNKDKYTIDKIAKYIIKYPQFTDSQIAEKFDLNRTKVWRARQLTLHVKFSTKTDSKKGTALTYNGFEGEVEEVIDDKTKVKQYRVIRHAGGPITGRRSKINPLLFGEPQYDEDVINHWSPHMQLVVNDEKTGKPLTASAITYKRNSQKYWYPRYFSNPMQSLDYQTFEAHSRSTIGGPLMRSFVTFLVGKGFRPELELINPGEDSIENQKEIDANQDIVKALIQIEQQFSFDENGHLDIAFQDKIKMMILNCFTFNRGAIIQRYDHSVSLNDKNFTGLPTSGINAHPRELGIIETDPLTSRLKQVQWENSNGMIDIDEMIYLWNPLVSANTHNSMHYGDSMMLPMIDALRIIRTNIGVNFRAMGTNAYSGLGLLIVSPNGSSESTRQAEYDTISGNIVPATTNILMEDPKDVNYFDVNYNPQVDQFINMTESMVKYSAACLGMPHSQFYDESASNRACYSEDTLTLTESGWKSYNEIDWRNERIATLNPENGNIEYHYPDGIAVYPYEGDMIHVKTKNQDVLVTPDHDMWVSSSHDERYVKFEKIKAERLTDRKDFTFAEFGEWQGQKVPELYNLSTVKMNSSNYKIQQQYQQPTSVKTDTWIQFMGYYLSEGTKSRPEKHGSKYFAELSQHTKSRSYDNFKSLCDKMPFNCCISTDKDGCGRFRFNSKQIVHNLQDTGLLHDTKQIPRWMLELQPKKLEILFDALMEGDGTVNKEGSKIYYTTSIQLARDVQELALKIGYGANLKTHYEAYGNKSKAYRVFITKNKRHIRRIRQQDVSRVPYKGIVYCFGVKNHLFVTSRNGTVTVQGNTMIGKIDLTIATVMNPLREWLDRALSPQIHDKWFRQIYAKDDELLKTFRVKLVFDDLHFSEWFDKVEAANELESRKELTDKAYGELLGMDNYTGKVKSDAITVPGGSGGGQSLNFGDGSKLKLKEPKESLQK